MILREPPALHTPRLHVRPARAGEAAWICALWRDPRVTTFVGFPHGIPTSVREIEARIERDRDRPPKRLLIVERSTDGTPIGKVKLGEPDADGVSEPDIKLLPEHWRQGFGRELWGAMIGHIFRTTDCQVVQGTPNVANTASIRMMEAAGMRRVGQGVFEPTGPLRNSMTAVPHFVYRITRKDWREASRQVAASGS